MKKQKAINKKENSLPEKSLEILYVSIRKIIEDARNRIYRTANFETVGAHWNIGKLITEEEQNGAKRAEYGAYIIEKLAKKLTKEYGAGFDERNLLYMRKFYQTWPIPNALRSELSWTHYRILMRVKKESTRNFYMKEAIECNWGTRTLERQIYSLYYERILMTRKEGRPLVKQEAESKKEPLTPEDFIKDPVVLEFAKLKPNPGFYEKELEQAIIDKLQDFLLELGKGFSFVGRQYRITADTKHFYIDLVFYNYILKCFLLIDLKTGELGHEDIGQMDMYVRYFEDKIRQENDSPTIGLILCAKKNHTVAKYSLLNDSKQIFASRYQTYLPTIEELEKEIESERRMIEMEKKFPKIKLSELKKKEKTKKKK